MIPIMYYCLNNMFIYTTLYVDYSAVILNKSDTEYAVSYKRNFVLALYYTTLINKA
jgi:hypothetical protein